MGLRWGFSLDYVPHVEGGSTVRWHRTYKSARLDLTIDPIDAGSGECVIAQDFFAEEAEAVRKVSDRAHQVVDVLERDALPLLTTVDTVPQLEPLFVRWLDSPARRFGFWNYLQAPLAYTFTLAYLRREDAAREWLGRTFEHQPELTDKVRQKLNDHLDELLHKAPNR